MRNGLGNLLVSLFSLALVGACASTSPFDGLEPDDLFEMGAREFEASEWDRATEAFERLIFTEPTYERLVEARMYLARAYYNKGEFITSVSEFTRVLDRHPGHELAPEASVGICQSYVAQAPHVQRDQTVTVQAWSACQNTLIDFRGTPVAAEAEALRDQMEDRLAEKIFTNGDFYFRRKLYHSGIIYFNDVLDQYPRNQWAAQALLRLHQSYLALEWGTEAEEARDRLIRDFPDSDAAREIGADGGSGGYGGKGPV
ncbi:MAG: outer membrane protein assembly factor BamD [Gemmatimonadetes bacterium]|nr:outer membrane protein assembly factor BamD [Gemmatimonadota bacterium]NNM04817.1 outer membrane protein assembly factor BamD [Gemmatimonadota bacterium]